MTREWTVLTNVLSEVVVEAHDLPGALHVARQTHPEGEVVGVIEISPLTTSPSKRPRGRPKGWRKKQTTAGDLPQPSATRPVPPVEVPHEQRQRGRPRLHDREVGHCECGNPSLKPGTDDVRCARCREIEGMYLGAVWGLVPKATALNHTGYSGRATASGNVSYNPSPPPWPQFDSRDIANPRLARFIRRLNY